MELKRNWNSVWKNCEILTAFMFFLVVCGQGQHTNGTVNSTDEAHNLPKCSCNISLNVTDVDRDGLEDACHNVVSEEFFLPTVEFPGHGGILRCNLSTSDAFSNCSSASCIVITKANSDVDEGSGSGEGPTTSKYQCCWTPIQDSNPQFLSLLLGLSIALAVLVLLVLVIAIWWWMWGRKSGSVVVAEKNSTTMRGNSNVTVQVPPGGIDNPALEYTNMSELNLRASPDGDDTLESNGHEVALSQQDKEAYDNGIVPLQVVEMEKFRLESEDTKL